jgi:hypothetical protein
MRQSKTQGIPWHALTRQKGQTGPVGEVAAWRSPAGTRPNPVFGRCFPVSDGV